MGKAYVFKASKADRATTKATRFIRAIAKSSNRRATVMGVVQDKRSNLWACTVDVCGPPNVKIDQIARKYE